MSPLHLELQFHILELICVCQLCLAGPQWSCSLQRTGSNASSRQLSSSAALWRTKWWVPKTSVSPCWTLSLEVPKLTAVENILWGSLSRRSLGLSRISFWRLHACCPGVCVKMLTEMVWTMCGNNDVFVLFQIPGKFPILNWFWSSVL